jgi:hypothetical protein
MTNSNGSKPRGFELTVEPVSADDYGLRLEESDGASQEAKRPVANLGPSASRRLVEQAMDALQASGFRRSDLSAQRRQPFRLKEHHGVRLALAMVATGPLHKRARVEAVLSGVARMSDEETYYWYAKCLGPEASRGRRSLRLMLAEE